MNAHPPSSSIDPYRSGHGSRPRTPTARSSTGASHINRHRKTSSDVGIFVRPQESPSALASRIPRPIAPGHNYSVFTVHTPAKFADIPSPTFGSNEVYPVLRIPGRPRPTEHAPAACTTNLPPLIFPHPQVPAVSLNDPPSLSSSLTSAVPSLAAPPTPHSHRSYICNRPPFITPSPSTSSLRALSSKQHQLRRTASPSPLSHGARTCSHRSLADPTNLALPHAPPSPSPAPLLAISRGLVPQRARPTLAMSMQVHAPTPILSSPTSPSSHTLSRSRAGSASRPSSPLASTLPLSQRPPMPRPPSRSERLLRDTLRRAEEQERVMHPSPSLFKLGPPTPGSPIPPAVAQVFGPCRSPASGRRHRRNTSSSVQSESSCDYFDDIVDEESQEDEEPSDWMSRVHPSPNHGYGHAHHPARTTPSGLTEYVPYGTPASPSPARVQLQRSAKTSPSVPRRHSHSQSASHVPTHAPSKGSVDVDRSAYAVTPHDAVLRNKLEGVLKTARAHDKRARSVERHDPDSGFSSGHSMASSRNLSGESDFFFGANGDSSLTSLSSNEPAKRNSLTSGSSPRVPARHLHPLSSPRTPHKPLKGNPTSGPGALTPPPSPPFNALQAAAQCKAMDGYISFANIEGLGVPEGSDEDTDEDSKSRSRWFQWLHITGKANNERTRDRSDSSSASR